MNAPTVALIHATPLAMEPIAHAFAELWPAAQRMNLLDDSLPRDLELAGEINASLRDRFLSLARYAEACGASGILFSCSAFGSAIESVAAAMPGIPVLKPNEAMFDAALDVYSHTTNVCRIALLSTFAPSVPGMSEEFAAMAQRRHLPTPLITLCQTEALQALNQGQREQHDELVVSAAHRLAEQCDVLMLGQFSMAHLHERIAAETRRTILSSPQSAVLKLRRSIECRPLQTYPATHHHPSDQPEICL